jgi:glutamate 5-kinase
MAGGSGSALGKGGMLTKVLAAKRAALGGTDTVIAYGREEQVLTRLAAGESIGTRLNAQTSRVNARKAWLAGHLKPAGRVWLDEGAARALTNGGRSLLPVGVVRIEGEFQRGELVACMDPNEREIGRGLINYPASEARAIAGKPSAAIESILGYLAEPELIHRDNLVLV